MQALKAALVVAMEHGGYTWQRNLCCIIQLRKEDGITSDVGQAGVDGKLAASPYVVHAGPPLPDTCSCHKGRSGQARLISQAICSCRKATNTWAPAFIKS